MNIDSFKQRIVQRLGLNLCAYTGNPECNEQWLKGYEQAKRDVRDLIKQLEIYSPYLD